MVHLLPLGGVLIVLLVHLPTEVAHPVISYQKFSPVAISRNCSTIRWRSPRVGNQNSHQRCSASLAVKVSRESVDSACIVAALICEIAFSNLLCAGPFFYLCFHLSMQR